MRLPPVTSRRPTVLHPVLWLVGFLALTSCVDDEPAEPVTPQAPRWTVATLPAESIFGDAPFMEVARQVPTFAGYYYAADQPGELVVAMASPADFNRAASLIRSALQRGSRGQAIDIQNIVPHEVEYTFLELARYRTVLRGSVFGVPGVTSLGVDESDNRVRIGIEEGSVELEVRDLLATLGVPEDAVIIYIDPRAVSTALTLDDAQPDGLIQGGWQIDAPGSGPCTLGFPAKRHSDQAPVFVSASHCTYKRAEPDGYSFRQPEGGQVIGPEIVDPYAHLCGSNLCREADAALMSASVPIDFEKIARTTQRSSCDACGASLNIDTANPTLTITDTYPHTIEGETLDKIGQTTGWTYGEVFSTCDDIEVDNLVKLCSDRINFSVDFGDSGSPVFRLAPYGNVQLRGIVWGRNANLWRGRYGIISDLHQIQKDLGSLVFAGLRAKISGPSNVQPNTTCRWTAWVDGGAGGFTYEWRRFWEVVGTRQEVFLDTGTTEFYLTLTVTDAWGDIVEDVLNVSVSSWAGECSL